MTNSKTLYRMNLEQVWWIESESREHSLGSDTVVELWILFFFFYCELIWFRMLSMTPQLQNGKVTPILSSVCNRTSLKCHCVLSGVWLCSPMDCSPPSSPVHVIFPQEYWCGSPFPPPGYLPDPGIEPVSLALAGGFFTTSTTWEVLKRH